MVTIITDLSNHTDKLWWRFNSVIIQQILSLIMEKENIFINYNELLDTLFEQWKKCYDRDDSEKFCKDGLVIIPDKKEDENYVNKAWHSSQRRVAFLLKDKNTPEADDIR